MDQQEARCRIHAQEWKLGHGEFETNTHKDYFHKFWNWIFLKPRKVFDSSDVICWQRTGSILAQVMARCLTALSHYPNHCWHIVSKVPWHSYDDIIVRKSEYLKVQISKSKMKIAFSKLRPDFTGTKELINTISISQACWSIYLTNLSFPRVWFCRASSDHMWFLLFWMALISIKLWFYAPLSIFNGPLMRMFYCRYSSGNNQE